MEAQEHDGDTAPFGHKCSFNLTHVSIVFEGTMAVLATRGGLLSHNVAAR